MTPEELSTLLTEARDRAHARAEARAQAATETDHYAESLAHGIASLANAAVVDLLDDVLAQLRPLD